MDVDHNADTDNSLSGSGLAHEAVLSDTSFELILNTPELLENVLRYLSNIDLLCSKGVCCTFRDVIETSPCLQKKLFLKPASRNDIGSWSWKSNNAVTRLPKKTKQGLGAEQVARPVEVNVYNDMVLSRRKRCDADPESRRIMQRVTYSQRVKRFSLLEFKIFEHRMTSFETFPADSIYRSMFLTQPPITTALIYLIGEWRHVKEQRSMIARLDVVNEDGVRVSDIVESVREEIAKDAGWGFDAISLGTANVIISPWQMGL